MFGYIYDRKKRKKHQVALTIPTTTRDRMKTRRATFANFTKFTYAQNYFHVIDICHNKEITI